MHEENVRLVQPKALPVREGQKVQKNFNWSIQESQPVEGQANDKTPYLNRSNKKFYRSTPGVEPILNSKESGSTDRIVPGLVELGGRAFNAAQQVAF